MEVSNVVERILIVDDDKDLRFNLSCILKEEDYEVIAAADGKQALNVLAQSVPDLVLLDIRLPGRDGVELLEEMKKIGKNLPIIMLTAYSEVKSAVKAMKLGAYDYITKPFDIEELILSIKKALQTRYLSREVEFLRKKLAHLPAPIEETMGDSPRIKQVLKQVGIIATTNMTVILQGESGTGKELIAKMIHEKSPRKDKPFIAIDSGAIPDTLVESELFGYEKGAFTGADARKEGKFEQANTGTLLLDEITNLSDAVQMKLLRVIQERRLQRLGGKKDIHIDVRIIVASNVNLPEAVRAGKFRDDLYHRLNEFQIELPGLAERKEDIPILAKYFLEEANSEFNKEVRGFSSEAMKFLLNYGWPGNVRELKNVTRRAVLLAESDTVESGNLSLNQTMPSLLEAIHPALSTTENNSERRKGGANPMKPLDEFRPFYFEEIPGSEKGRDRGVSFGEITQEFQKDLIKRVLDAIGDNKVKTAKILKLNRKTLYRKMKSLGL